MMVLTFQVSLRWTKNLLFRCSPNALTADQDQCNSILYVMLMPNYDPVYFYTLENKNISENGSILQRLLMRTFEDTNQQGNIILYLSIKHKYVIISTFTLIVFQFHSDDMLLKISNQKINTHGSFLKVHQQTSFLSFY